MRGQWGLTVNVYPWTLWGGQHAHDCTPRIVFLFNIFANFGRTKQNHTDTESVTFTCPVQDEPCSWEGRGCWGGGTESHRGVSTGPDNCQRALALLSHLWQRWEDSGRTTVSDCKRNSVRFSLFILCQFTTKKTKLFVIIPHEYKSILISWYNKNEKNKKEKKSSFWVVTDS